MVAALLGGVFGAGGAEAARSVRGFDGTTVKVASLGIAAQFPGVPIGAQARIKRFNDTNEIKGIKISYDGFADDKGDPATALSESRRVVTQDGVFGIVGDTSASNPGAYFNQQHVPYFGWAFDNTYCSKKIDTSLYGFGYNGCLVPSDPSVMPNLGRAAYAYVSQKTGKKHPTLAVFSNDSQSGKNSVKFQASAYQGVGFDVVSMQNKMPAPPVSDYTPYAQSLLTADNGKAPDAIVCLLATDCIATYSLIQANGYTGTYVSSLYSDFLTKALSGSAANIAFVNLTENTPGLTQMKADVDAFQSGGSSKIDSGTVAGYTTTDMFIQALKAIAKKGKSNITPEALQKAAMNQTWQIKGLAGPTTYPNSTVAAYPACNSEVLSNGTLWQTVAPYACSKTQYKLNPKFG